MPTLDWLNRAAAFDIAKNVPYRLLEAVSEHRANVAAPDVKAPLNKGEAVESAESRLDLFSVLEPTLNKADSDKPLPPTASATVPATEDNLLIQGDNLEALKALLPFYRGQVKCVFIDPPYNTKSAFKHYDDNLEHAQWLSMMLPRLQLLRELLSEDGSIWVTIDDNEGHYLKVMMDEVFGRKNFIANVVWQKKYSKQNDALWLSTSHDHVFVYGKSALSWRPNKVLRTAVQLKGFANPDNDPRGAWQSVVYTCAKTRSERPNLFYAIKQPKAQTDIWPLESRVWGYDLSRHAQHVAENRIWWGADGEKDKPRLKVFLSELAEGVVPDTLWLRDLVGDNQDSKREVMALFEDEVFTTPKPERLMHHLLGIATNPNDLILDSFLGSGTTAAVSQKMGRRWIAIEMGKHAKTHCLPRLQKVLDGEQGGISKAVNWQGGGSFRFMQLGAPVFDETGAIHPKVRFATLAAFVWMQETRTPWHKKKGSSPYLGTHDGVAYYLLFNGILGDRRPQGGNVLTSAILAFLNTEHPHPNSGGPRIIYGESVRLGPARLAAENVTFKQIPYDVARG